MEEGFAPEAVVNYLCLLGWSPKDDRQVMPLEEIIGRFDLPQILRANARFDMAKLEWMNFEYLRTMDKARYRGFAGEALRQAGIDTGALDSAYVQAALDTCQEKLRKFTELPGYGGFYFTEEFDYDPDAAAKHFTAGNRPHVQKLRDAFAALATFDAASLETALKGVATELGVKVGAVVHPVRLACTGKPVGPSLYHLMEVLGRERVLQRLDKALARMPLS
jgi:glutamyl/glutaminyl-tRNA synthetase